MVVVELLFRRLAPGSAAYRRWTAFFQGIGAVWTAVLLALIYLVSVGPISVVMRLRDRDPLDRALRPEPSFWRAHEPNPLGPLAAARHQF
ncbi:MAG TPA: SxtJ family membrane protein [Vicinamibacteria bacterium]